MDKQRNCGYLFSHRDILEIQGEIVFKIIAYRRAADAIEHLGATSAIFAERPKNLQTIPHRQRDL